MRKLNCGCRMKEHYKMVGCYSIEKRCEKHLGVELPYPNFLDHRHARYFQIPDREFAQEEYVKGQWYGVFYQDNEEPSGIFVADCNAYLWKRDREKREERWQVKPVREWHIPEAMPGFIWVCAQEDRNRKGFINLNKENGRLKKHLAELKEENQALVEEVKKMLAQKFNDDRKNEHLNEQNERLKGELRKWDLSGRKVILDENQRLKAKVESLKQELKKKLQDWIEQFQKEQFENLSRMLPSMDSMFYKMGTKPPMPTPALDITGWERVDEKDLLHLKVEIGCRLRNNDMKTHGHDSCYLCLKYKKLPPTSSRPESVIEEYCSGCPVFNLKNKDDLTVCFHFALLGEDNRRAFLTSLLAEVENRLKPHPHRKIFDGKEFYIAWDGKIYRVDAKKKPEPTLSWGYVFENACVKFYKDWFFNVVSVLPKQGKGIPVPVQHVIDEAMKLDVGKRKVVLNWLSNKGLIYFIKWRNVLGGRRDYYPTGKSL